MPQVHTPTQSTVTAVLGPTNTGKTFLAMDRLLGHATGMIGFPLRLLARENYDKAVAIKGPQQVALITGEEKIIPPNARYFICTVESMPVDRRVAFLAVDEIQLAADRERGHVFTDRLLNSRGDIETMFLGSETVRPLIRQLVPGVQFEARPRFSKLSYAGPKKLTRLPRRSAVVAFSASEVYGIADLIRRQRGGAAVVMGALSPRTRNAQVGLYQSGEVDYLVATDAIGMGLNMDVNHVAFASVSKFDGRTPRALRAPELGQIAGRAGRHMNDGTFGTTANAPDIDPDAILRIESHDFAPLKSLYWRNTNLTFATVPALVQSLKKHTPAPVLTRPPVGSDQIVLEDLAGDSDVRTRAKGAERVRLLWDVAQVPDFRKLRTESHGRLLQQVYMHLSGETGRIPEDWVAEQVARIDRHDGDIHTLMDRIAAIRIWTYLANRPGWVENAPEWQGNTRAVEDKLSDALHEKLTLQFIDHRTAHLVKKLKSNERVVASVDKSGQVGIDGHFIGELNGLTFKADKTGLKTADRAVINAANTAVAPELSRRVEALIAADNSAFALTNEAKIVWDETPIARLCRGPHPLTPDLELIADERLDTDQRQAVRVRLEQWFSATAQETLPGLKESEAAAESASVRGLMYVLAESLGTVDRTVVEAQIKSLTDEDKKALARLGVRLGIHTVYVPAGLKAPAVRLRAILWRVFADADVDTPPPPDGRVSFETVDGVPADFYRCCGFRPVRGTAYRIDMVERFAAEVRRLLREKVSMLPPANLSPLGIGAEKAVELLKSLGFVAKLSDAGLTIGTRRKPSKAPKKTTKKKARFNKQKEKPYDPDSPFAKLKDLVSS